MLLLADTAIAVEEAITTPLPPTGHGKVAEAIGLVVWVATIFRII